MANSLTITIISGWAIPESWLAGQAASVCPQADIHCVYPRDPFDPEEAEHLLTTPADAVIGYSLGSLWLLHHRALIPESVMPVLMAPILAFPQEAGLGGKTPKSQLEFFLRTVERTQELPTVLGDFLALGEIVLPDAARRSIPERDVLARGLVFLRDASVTAEDAGGMEAVLGDRDPFTDAAALKPFLPDLHVLQDCGHQPGPLLRAVFQHTRLRQRVPSPVPRNPS